MSAAVGSAQDNGTTDNATSSEAAPDEVVLLVHGTFAAQPDDHGSEWWQHGSPCWRELGACLPPGVRMPNVGEIFHWTGKNSDRLRRVASDDLLDAMIAHERAGHSYHVIAHSHGGAVVWAALRMSLFRDAGRLRSRRRLGPYAGLPHLRSWTTVGTPFLSLRRPSVSADGRALAWLSVCYALLTAVCVVGGAALALRFRGPAVGVGRTILGAGALALILAVVFAVVGRALVRRAIPHVEAAIDAWTAWTYGRRWLGIWDAQDEAIAALNGSVSIGRSPGEAEKRLRPPRLVPRRLPSVRAAVRRWPPVRAFARRAAARRVPGVLPAAWTDETRSPRPIPAMEEQSVYETLHAPFAVSLRAIRAAVGAVAAVAHDGILAPLGDRLAWGVAQRSAHGNDRRDGAPVRSVRVAPDPLLGAPRALPNWISAAIAAHADRNASRRVAELRALLADVAYGRPPALDPAALAGELVHTCYFDVPAVLDLIALHVAVTSRSGRASTARATSPGVVRWYEEFRADTLPGLVARGAPPDGTAAHNVLAQARPAGSPALPAGYLDTPARALWRSVRSLLRRLLGGSAAGPGSETHRP